MIIQTLHLNDNTNGSSVCTWIFKKKSFGLKGDRGVRMGNKGWDYMYMWREFTLPVVGIQMYCTCF